MLSYTHTLIIGALALMPLSAHADKRISILNPSFREKAPGANTPKDWVVNVKKGANLSQVSKPGLSVVTMFGTGAVMEQSFLSSEATADKFSTYYITFDAGWRNNSKKNQIFSFVFELVNVTDNTVLGKAIYVIPPNAPSNKYDDYRVASRGTTLRISFDNTNLSLRGDEVSLRISSESSMESEDIQLSHQLTGWIDNIYVKAAK
ncbi:MULTISPECIES: hypothetical protein [Rubritalea]|nr:hypothetical protein [Rubritalea squalenifaciens]